MFREICRFPSLFLMIVEMEVREAVCFIYVESYNFCISPRVYRVLYFKFVSWIGIQLDISEFEISAIDQPILEIY